MRKTLSITILNVFYWTAYIINIYNSYISKEQFIIIAFMYFFTSLIIVTNNEK